MMKPTGHNNQHKLHINAIIHHDMLLLINNQLNHNFCICAVTIINKYSKINWNCKHTAKHKLHIAQSKQPSKRNSNIVKMRQYDN